MRKVYSQRIFYCNLQVSPDISQGTQINRTFHYDLPLLVDCPYMKNLIRLFFIVTVAVITASFLRSML